MAALFALLPIFDSNDASVRASLVQCVGYVLHKESALAAKSKSRRGPGIVSISPKQSQAFIKQYLAKPENPLYHFLMCTFQSLLSDACDHKQARQRLCDGVRALIRARGKDKDKDAKTSTTTTATTKPAAEAKTGAELSSTEALTTLEWGWCSGLATAATRLPDRENGFRALRCLATAGYHIALADALIALSDAPVSVSAAASAPATTTTAATTAATTTTAQTQTQAQSGLMAPHVLSRSRMLEALLHMCNMPDVMLQCFRALETNKAGNGQNGLAAIAEVCFVLCVLCCLFCVLCVISCCCLCGICVLCLPSHRFVTLIFLSLCFLCRL